MTLWEVLALATLDDIAEIGLACEQLVGRDRLPCLEVAVGVVHWPSGDVRCCALHTRAWHDIAIAMGIHNLQVTPSPVRRVPTFEDAAATRASLLDLD